ncbi:MAG: alpha-galactosidase [Candidatus Neomarinimicrobiota bacterium]|nr:MAG: alpha-galactosidase [Candidatus Neomarinimicrobiota bacterium]
MIRKERQKKIWQIAAAMLSLILILTCLGCSQAVRQSVKEKSSEIWLDELGAQYAIEGWGETQANKSIDGNPLTIAGKMYERGIGTHAPGFYAIKLDGKAKSFKAFVGIDDEVKDNKWSQVEFKVISYNEKTTPYENVLWESGLIKYMQPAKKVDINLEDVTELRLIVTDGNNGIYYDHADWADAKIEYDGSRPEPIKPYTSKPYILTPKPGPSPEINGPKVFGVRPGSPFLFTIPTTGDRPMTFSAEGLPDGLKLDSNSGIITGTIKEKGIYNVKFIAKNEIGRDKRDFRIEVGDEICLTPPMGWNSWNCWGCSVTDENVRASAEAMVDKGLINYGWNYINIDDCWHGERDPETGEIRANEKFPDMKALSNYVHSKGLKIGLYTDCGPMTCQNYEGSENHEQQDIFTYAKWGFDYVKVDWCHCEKKNPRSAYKKFGDAIKNSPRDIIFSICNWGKEKPWEWGASVGGNLWRTTGDIWDSWGSMSGIGFGQAGLSEHAGPGHWNDPDMLVVGNVGWGPDLHPSNLTPDEQYTHISLWCLLSAPLLIGCPIEQMDDFTMNLLTNEEVLAVDQDPLGDQAKQVLKKVNYQIWAKNMEDGSMAIGLFNMDAYKHRGITVEWSQLGLKGNQRVRDLWRQKDLGVFKDQFRATIPPHGVVMVRVTPE